MAVLFEPGSIGFDNGALIAERDTVVHEWTAHGRSSSGALRGRVLRDLRGARCRIAEVREYLDARHVARVLLPELG
ncbi:MAG: hypothetical protein ACR2OB_04770 [Solirubrobacteraceae bacterium]